MCRLREEGLAAAGSTLDRYAEMSANCRKVQNRRVIIGTLPLKTKHPRFRSDGIVLLTSEEDADRVLELVLETYHQNAGRFNSREAGQLMAEVAPGVGVSDNHGYLTNQRRNPARLIAKTIGLCQADLEPYQTLGYDHFKEHLTKLAKTWGLDFHNLAFEL